MASRCSSPARPPGRRRVTGGFTLLELLLVLALLSVFSGIGFALTGAVSSRSARLQAEAELAVLAAAMERFRQHWGSYPQTEEAAGWLAALEGRSTPAGAPARLRPFLGPGAALQRSGPESAAVLLDPWGASYRYRPTDASSLGGYELWSAGPDGGDELVGAGVGTANADNVYVARP